MKYLIIIPYIVQFFDNLTEANDVCEIARSVVILEIRIAEPVIYDDELVTLTLLGSRLIFFRIMAVLKSDFFRYYEIINDLTSELLLSTGSLNLRSTGEGILVLLVAREEYMYLNVT